MSDTDRATHSDLIGTELEAAVTEAGDESLVYDESDVPSLENENDGRAKTVLVSGDLIRDAGDLLVDVVEYGPGVSCPVHYHEGTDHFFYILDGEGVLEVEDEETILTAGTVAWIGEGDRHRLFTREDQEMRVLEYFSNDDHEVTLFGDRHSWVPDESETT